MDVTSKLIKVISIALILYSCLFSCENRQLELLPVSRAHFQAFVDATGYITDAEKFGWSVVQKDVYNFKVVDNANWRKPDGLELQAMKDLPVTQVSYNDALAYCEWSHTRLPSYDEYWQLIKNDDRKIVSNYNAPISNISEVNLLGNVWEITNSIVGDSVRLAGGSLFCSPTTCHGTSKERELYVDKETGNIHIGFAVVAL